MNTDLLNHAPDKAEVIKVIQRITKAIGNAEPRTVFVACVTIMQVQADLMGINLKVKK